eukprot:3687776-Amphidinium_carterae.1
MVLRFLACPDEALLGLRWNGSACEANDAPIQKRYIAAVRTCWVERAFVRFEALRNAVFALFMPSCRWHLAQEWYRATHMLLHKEAREAACAIGSTSFSHARCPSAQVVAAIRCGQVAARECNTEAIVESLAKLTTWLNTFCDYFDGHFENK